MTTEDDSWHLSKKVTIGMMMAIVLQSVSFIGSAWAVIKNMDANIQKNTYDIVELKAMQVEDTRINRSYTAHEARAESKFDNLARGQMRIEKKLDRLIERAN